MKQVRINVATPVMPNSVRTEQRNGRTVLIVPSKTLPDNIIMNGVLYPADEIKKAFNTLEGTQAPLGHPQVDGQYVNALHPVALNSCHIGAHNENVRQENGVVLLDKVIDVEVAERTEQGRKVLEAINKGDPMHTSTGLTYDPKPAPKGAGYHTIATNMIFDHDCILLDEPGAATPAQGVGMMVNALLEGGTVARREKLTAALRSLAPQGDGWYYMQDENDTQMIYSYEPKEGPSVDIAVGYVIGADGVVTFDSEFHQVQRVTMWERVKSVVLKLATNKSTQEAVKMTPEELKAQLDAHTASINELLEKNTTAVSEQLTAVNTAIAELGAGERARVDALTAANRKVVADKFGDVIANGLEGDALADMAAKCQADGATAPVVGANAADLSQTLPE